jgi:FtsH-binding integral membrane protein
MKKKIKILNIMAICLIVAQVIGYLGNAKEQPIEAIGIDAIAYYIGFNLFGIIAIILFIICFFLRQKLKQNEKKDIIDSIGKE